MPTKAHKAAGARLCRVLAFAWASFAPQAFAFDSPFRSVAWHQLDSLARAAAVIGCVVIPAVMLCLLAAGGRKERRLGLALVGALALLWGSYARLAGTVWFVRPESVDGVNVNYGAEDGTSFANAFDGFSDITWASGAGSVAAGDTVLVCDSGEHFHADSADGGAATMLTVTEPGTAGVPVTIDGDCSAYGGLSQAIIDPENSATVTRGIHTLTNANITLKNMRVQNIAGTTISVGLALGTSSAEVSTDKNIIVDNVDVVGVEGAAADETSKKCVTGFGGDIEVKNSHFEDCWDDAIQITGAGALVHDNTFARVSQGTTDGDCVQLTGNTTGPSTGSKAYRNTCDHSDKDTKQCFIMGAAADSPVREVTDNVCYMPIGATTSNGILITGGTGTVARNFVRGGNTCVQANSGDALNASANVCLSQTEKGIYAGSSVTAASITNNTASDIGQGAGATATACFASDVNTADHIIRNNVCSGSDGAGIDRQGTTAIETNNLVYDAATPASLNCTTATCAAQSTTLHASDVTSDPKFVGGPNPTTAEGFRPSATSPLVGAGTDVGSEQDFFGDTYYSSPDIGAFRRDSCYRRSRDGKLDMARTRAQVASRCLGIPGRYPEGL